jgi:hypothetical protein
MVYTMELSCVFNAHHIAYALYDANGPMVSGLVGTYGADIVVGYHPACTAILNFVAQIVYCGCEVVYILSGLLQKVKRQSKCAATPHSGERAYGIHCLFK